YRQYDFRGFETNEDIFTRFGDVFGDLFNRGDRRAREQAYGPFGAEPQPQSLRGQDLTHEVTISFEDALTGTGKTLAITRNGKKERIRVKIPAGIESGKAIRVKGAGYPGAMPGRDGDLLVTVNVQDDPRFERQGNDLLTDVFVPFTTAILGGRVRVETARGETVMLRVPPGTQTGKVLRLTGQGVHPARGARGDLRVRILITVPKTMTPEQESLIRKYVELEDAE
ncbi:MAG: J domain-containing protein, partial [Candidatus Poribacteria bacterium]|nr:J domain-containing protein [Candidatus Poribacteria bacterium]